MEAEQIHRVYFIGAGGIGMAALVRYFLRLGKPVAGYDRTPTPLTLALQQEGADLHFREAVEDIPSDFRNPANTLVIYTPAVGAGHKELAYFREQGFTIKKRAEVLGILSASGRCLAVAGTHGKTTTSCILAHLLREAGHKITAFLGGVSEDFESNFLMEGDEFTVVEADEFDRSFLWLRPEVACITSMDADHLDIYGTGEALVESFRDFAGKLRPGGTLLVRHGLNLPGLTYGIGEEGATYSIRNLKVEGGCYHFDIVAPGQVFEGLRFCKPGHHNLLNGLAAFAMAIQVVPPSQRLADALASFKGVQRRFTYRVNTENVVYIDDYAHHPAEIDAVCQAVREMHPGREILAVFQPHLFSRTRDFGKEFAQSLSRFDAVWLLDIYPAREQPLEGIDSHWLLEQIDNPRKKWISGERLIEEIIRARPQVLLTLGAGDIGLQAGPIENALCHEIE
jgi:UDP-N-acetylmuramate--alanine ligase